MLTTCCQKTLEFFQWLWLLTIINFIIAQLFAENRFLQNISARLVLTSKFFFEFDSMFCYHKFRMLQKGFSRLFFAWFVKWWVWLKLWTNHSRDWINNFPWFFTSTVLKEMIDLPRLPRIFIGNWGAACLQQRLILSCGWLEFRGPNASCSWFYLAASSSSDSWIRVAAVSDPGGWIQVTAEPSSSGWIQLTADSSSGGWIRVAADSILRLSRVSVTGYELQLTLSYGWLELRHLDPT